MVYTYSGKGRFMRSVPMSRKLKEYVKDPISFIQKFYEFDHKPLFKDLGGGAYGVAFYDKNNDIVFKITTDPSEAAIARELMSEDEPYVVHIYDIISIDDKAPFKVWILVEEYVPYHLPSQVARPMYDAYRRIVHDLSGELANVMSSLLIKGKTAPGAKVLDEFFKRMDKESPNTVRYHRVLKSVAKSLLYNYRFFWFDAHPGNFGFTTEALLPSDLLIYDIGNASVLRGTELLAKIDSYYLAEVEGTPVSRIIMSSRPASHSVSASIGKSSSKVVQSIPKSGTIKITG